MVSALSLVIVLKTITLLLGGLVTVLAVKAYWRTTANGLRFLAVGFAIITIGALLAGIIDQLLSLHRNTALVVESTLTALGFAIIAYSLYTD